jgi:hypothetical protein
METVTRSDQTSSKLGCSLTSCFCWSVWYFFCRLRKLKCHSYLFSNNSSRRIPFAAVSRLFEFSMTTNSRSTSMFAATCGLTCQWDNPPTCLSLFMLLTWVLWCLEHLQSGPQTVSQTAPDRTFGDVFCSRRIEVWGRVLFIPLPNIKILFFDFCIFISIKSKNIPQTNI